MDVYIAAVRELINMGFSPDKAQTITQNQLQLQWERDREEREWAEREWAERERERVHERQRNQHELEMARLKSQSKRNGVTTEAEFFTSLKDRNLITLNADIWQTIFNMELSANDHSLLSAYEGPSKDTPEVPDVQNFMNELFSKLLVDDPLYWADPNSSRCPSFGTRKPDNVIYKKDCSGPLAIVLFCENKGRYSDKSFSAQHCGHCLDMARELMEDFQPRRRFVFCFLSDGHRFQFFRVYRNEDDDLRYDMSLVYLGSRGLQNLLILLRREPAALGHVNEPLDEWTKLYVLGRGGQAVVYAVQRNETLSAVSVSSTAASVEASPPSLTTNTTAVLKEFRDQEAQKQEMKILQYLNQAGVVGVPSFVEVPHITSPTEFFNIIYTPIGTPVIPCPGGERTWSHQYLPLLHTVWMAHNVNIVHRDIKPENVFIIPRGNHDTQLMLNDWGSAVSLSEGAESWQGSRMYYTAGEHPSKAADLRAIVRTVQVMYRQESPRELSNDVEIAAYWAKEMPPRSIWAALIESANKCDYYNIAQMLSWL